MSRQLVILILASLALTVLAPVAAEAQFYPIFQKDGATDDDVDEALMGFPPAHPCPDPCNELHTVCRVINCGSLNPDGTCGMANPPLTGGVFVDELPSTLLLDCVRGVTVTGDGTWDPPICDVASNTVTVENINVISGGTVEISFWSTIDCENGVARNDASLEWDQNPMPGNTLEARDPAALFGTGYSISVGETAPVAFIKDVPALTVSGMPPMRPAPPGSTQRYVITGANPTCGDLTVFNMQDVETPRGCVAVDCDSLRMFINDVPTPIPPDTLCPEPSIPIAFQLGEFVLPPGATFRLEYDALLTGSAGSQCCNYGDFSHDGGPNVQTSDPGLDAPLMPESTCVSLGEVSEPAFNAIKDAEDGAGNPISVVEPGQTLDWRFTLENNGAADGMVDMDDTFPALAVVTPASIVTPFPTGTCSITGQTLTCTDVVVNVGDRVEMVVRSTVDCAATGGDTICNEGNLSGPAGSFPTHCPTCPAMAPGNATCVEVQAPAFPFASKVGADADGDGVVDVGETITWTINPVNSGTADGRNVILTDLIPTGSSYVPGTLALDGLPLSDAADGDAGEEVAGTITVRLGDVTPVSGVNIVTFDTLVDSVADPAICNDSASLAWDLGACPPGAFAIAEACVPTVSAPNVSASKAVTPTGDVERAGLLTYSVEVCNDPSASAATGILVEDPIPAGSTYENGSMTLDGAPLSDAADGDAGEFLGGPPASVSILVDDLAPGECKTATFDVTVDGDASGSVSNTATVSGDGVPPFDTNRVANGIIVPNPAELGAIKSVSPNGSVEEGSGATLTYSIAACNGAMAPMARNVVVDDDIPAGSTYVPGTIALDGAPLTDITDGDGGEFVVGPPARVLVTVGDLNPGECGTVTFDVTVDIAATGSVLNTASVSSNAVPRFDTNEVETPIDPIVVDPPRLSVTKDSMLLGMPPAMVGDAISYSLTACNDIAGGPAGGVVLTDLIPNDVGTGCGASYVPSSLTLDGVPQTDMADTDPGRFEAAPAPGQIVVDIDTLDPGECVVVAFEVMIEAGCSDRDTIENVATLTATGEAPLDSNMTSETVGVDPMPGDPVMLRKEGFPLLACADPASGCGCEVALRLDPVMDDCLMSGTCSVIDPTSWLVPGELTRSATIIFYELDGAACRPDGDMEDLRVEKSEPDDIILRLVP